MPIPDFQTMMRPVLEILGEKDSCSVEELRDAIQEVFSLTNEEREEFLPSGKQRVFDNRVLWATNHLGLAGLLKKPKRGFFSITETGREFMESHEGPVRTQDLKKMPGYKESFVGKSKKPKDVKKTKKKVGSETPQEAIEDAYVELRDSLASELIKEIMNASPSFFEQLVIDLLVAMGYGGSFRDAAQTLGKAADGGIDGVIKQDILGLDNIYLQAKRWKDNVGRPVVQAFVGSLEGRHANKGVFITTSGFTEEAKRYAESIAKKVILIDGETLCEHMIDYKIGVRIARSYDLPAIDLDYFESEQ